MKNKAGIIHLLPLLLVGVLIVAVGAGAYYFSQKSDTPIIEKQIDETSESGEEVDMTEWETYTSEVFRVSYPSDIETRVEVSPYDENFRQLTLVKLGETQRLGTEIYDGYIITFFPQRLGNMTLSELVGQRVSETRQVGEILEEPAPYLLNDLSGISYTGSGLGTFKNVFLEHEGNVVQISILIEADPEEVGYQDTIDQIISTFEFIEVSDNGVTNENLKPPSDWVAEEYETLGLILHLPSDWESEHEYFSNIPSDLISMKKTSWETFPVQLDIKNDWESTGNAQWLTRDYPVTNTQGVMASRSDSPKKDQQTLARYQSNFYFEKNSKVYIFTCVHNWDEETLKTCEDILKYLEIK